MSDMSWASKAGSKSPCVCPILSKFRTSLSTASNARSNSSSYSLDGSYSPFLPSKNKIENKIKNPTFD